MCKRLVTDFISGLALKRNKSELIVFDGYPNFSFLGKLPAHGLKKRTRRSMQRKKVLGIILAGGVGGRLDVLTERRAKPAMPFAGVYRLIDFALSNCVHSRISDVWVIEQFQPHSLNEHLANGRPWDLDRTYGGLQVLPPFISKTDEGGFAEGNADAIYRHINFIREFDPDILLVLSADHVYKLDFQEVIDRHLELDADATIVTTQIPLAEAARFGNVKADKEGRVTEFHYKPDAPQSEFVTTEVFVYDAPLLLATLEELAAEGKKKGGKSAKADNGESSLKDFGHELIPKLVRDNRVYDYRLEGYWRDVGTVESYWQGHMDLLAPETALKLDDARWPILTFGTQRLPAHIHKTASIENSLVSAGCDIRGRIIRSVLAPGVVVEEGATVRDSVLLNGAVVRAGAEVSQAILDERVEVGKNASVGKKSAKGKTKAKTDLNEQITVVGLEAHVPARKQITIGARIEPRAIGEDAKEKRR